MVSLPPIVAAVRRRRHGGFNLRTAFFGAGEAGGVYDPSDLTAEKVAWRRNLLTWSEDFTNAAWTKDACTITANTATAPDGTLTADKIVSNNATAQMGVGQSFTAVAREYTASWYVKQAEVQFVQMLWSGGASANFANVNLATGTVTAGTYTSATVTDAGSGWYRITITSTLSAGSAFAYLWLVNSGAAGRAAAYTGNGTNGVLAWGAQLDLGSTATAYQRITDFTSDFLAAFPTHALYQDSAGTTPVTALGQPVGLAIDKSRGGLASLGAELVTNGDFSSGTLTGWHVGSAITASVVSGEAQVTFAGAISSTTNNWFSAGPIVDTGDTRTFYVEFDATWVSGAGSLQAGIGYNTRLTVAPNAGKTRYRIAGNNLYGGFGISTVSGAVTFGTTASATVWRIDNVSVKLIPGVHAIQPTSASRPLLDGRVNLLTRTEEFDNAAWDKGTGGSISANSVMAPDGRMTADAYTWATSTLQFGFLSQSVSGAPQVAHQYTIYLKVPAGIGSKQLRLRMSDVTTSTADSSNVTVTESWQAFTFTRTSANATGQVGVALNVASGGPANGIAAGDVLHVWGADLRLATDAAYPYQRVAAATDYADVGVPRSFAFDGFDDSLYTASNMDLSGTDKVTVLAGVRKLSDAARGMFVELGLASANNFYISAPNNAGSTEYNWIAGGTVLRSVNYANAAVAAPNTSVLTGIVNIPAPLLLFRVNGTQVGSDTQSQGTGNFASAILYIGRRTNTTLPFNGKAYQLIVRGALTDAATLAQAERYVGAKTGIFL